MTDNLIDDPEEGIEPFNLGKKYKQFTQKGGVEFLQRFLTSISKQCILNKDFLKNLCEENKSSIKDHETDPDKVLKRITLIKIKRKGLSKRDISMPKELEFLLKMIKKGRIEFKDPNFEPNMNLLKNFSNEQGGNVFQGICDVHLEYDKSDVIVYYYKNEDFLRVKSILSSFDPRKAERTIIMDGEDHVLLCNQIRLFTKYTLHNLDINAYPEFGGKFVNYCKGFIAKSKGWDLNQNDESECTEGKCSSFDFLFKILQDSKCEGDYETLDKFKLKVLDFILTGTYKDQYCNKNILNLKENANYARCPFDKTKQFHYKVSLEPNHFCMFKNMLVKFRALVKTEYLCMTLYPGFVHFITDFWNKQKESIEKIIYYGNIRLQLAIQSEMSKIDKRDKSKDKDIKKKILNYLMPNCIYTVCQESIQLRGLQQSVQDFKIFMAECISKLELIKRYSLPVPLKRAQCDVCSKVRYKTFPQRNYKKMEKKIFNWKDDNWKYEIGDCKFEMMRESIKEEFEHTIDICYDTSKKNDAIVIALSPEEEFIKTPANASKREVKIQKALASVRILLNDHSEKEEGEEFSYDQFRAEDDVNMRDIKCRVVEE